MTVYRSFRNGIFQGPFSKGIGAFPFKYTTVYLTRRYKTNQRNELPDDPILSRHLMLECMEECAEGTPRAAPASADPCTKGIPNRFEFIAQIGEGTYGTVFKARDPRTPDDDIVALKKISLDDRDEGVPVTTLREVRFARALSTPYPAAHRPQIARTDSLHDSDSLSRVGGGGGGALPPP